MGESSPSVLQGLWPAPCPKEAAVRVAVERETEARSWPVVSLVPGGLGASPRFGIAVGHRRLSLSPRPALSALSPSSAGSGREELGTKFFQDFHGFFQLCEPQIHLGEREFYCSPLPLLQPEHFTPRMKGLPLSIPARDRCSCHADFYLSPTQNLLLFLLSPQRVGKFSPCPSLEHFPASGLRYGRETVSRMF